MDTNERETIRRSILDVLSREECDAHELSRVLSVSEKDIYHHLDHVRLTVRALGRRLRIYPAICLGCGFSFEDRNRFTSPGRCPRCKGEHIRNPRYRIL